MIEVPLTKGLVAVVDDVDAWVNDLLWQGRAHRNTYYATRLASKYENDEGKRIFQRMHRLILDAPKGVQVDHRDRDGLNNRRSNLRSASAAQQKQNNGVYKNSASGLKGVFPNPTGKYKWRVQITVEGRKLSLGRFSNIDEAARAYNDAAIRYFGEFACLNEIKEKVDD